MISHGVVVVGLLAAAAQPAAPAPRLSACAQALNGRTDGAATEACLGEGEARSADASPKGSIDRSRRLEAAAEHYRRAASLASAVETKARVLEALAEVYDPQHLNAPRELEATLRELIVLRPDDLDAVYRLSRLQEDQGLVDAAEATLLSARHQQPDAVEPNVKLAQFYARRATALGRQAEPQKLPTVTASAGDPDEHGVYRVGGAILPPARLDVAQYPPEAQAAGISGVVIAEVVINESGEVGDAKILRSIPMLDEAALKAVHNWHFTPTMVNGQTVPVRMVVTVNFPLPPGGPPGGPGAGAPVGAPPGALAPASPRLPPSARPQPPAR